MAKSITPHEAKLNEAIVHALIDNLPKDVAAVVGINALGELSELMPHEDFVRFVDEAVHHALTGRVPAEEPAAGDQDQGNNGESPAPQNGGQPNGTPSPTT